MPFRTLRVARNRTLDVFEPGDLFNAFFSSFIGTICGAARISLLYL
ncbi:hypothetical protein [Nitrosovibrio tenuis]|nr:hypothetical protein [Nitrosovibrio tenuis]